MLQGVEFLGGGDLGGGVATFRNPFYVKPNQTPNALNVRFLVGGSVEKRAGSNTMNATLLSSTAGWGVFDYGASAIRWLVVAAGTGIFASSNRGVSFVSIATSRTQSYQFFERSKPYLIATSLSSGAPVLYWGGSVGTFTAQLAVNSAPACKYAADFQGFLLLMNSDTRKRGVYYSDNNVILTDPWDSDFDLPSSFDDEITGWVILNKKLYVFTRYKIFRISYVGGNPDFSYQDVKDWGAVPGTIKKLTVPQVGEVVIALAWDRTLRIFDGADDEIVSTSFEQDNNQSPVAFSLINEAALETCRAEVDANEQVYKLLVPIGTAGVPTHQINFNYRTGAFYGYDGQQYHNLVMAESGNSRLLFAVARTGLVCVVDSGNRDRVTPGTGNAIVEYYDSPYLYSKSPRTVTKGHKTYLTFTPTSSGSIVYQERQNFASTYGAARHTLSFADTANMTQKIFAIDVPMTQNVYQFRLSSSGAAEQWELNRVDFLPTELGVGKG